MPNLTFVLPHWLYWSVLVAFPLVAMVLVRRGRGAQEDGRVSLALAYVLLLTGGFVGLHRFYLRSALGWVFVPLFVAVLVLNVQIRESRDAISNMSNEVVSSEFLIERAEKRMDDGRDGAQAERDEARSALAAARAGLERATGDRVARLRAVRAVAGLILLVMVIDALLLPHLLRRCRVLDESDPRHSTTLVTVPPAAAPQSRPAAAPRAVALVDAVNHFAGSFVAYWSPIAVLAYYYEVLARYVFNSPTNWAHEGMFLMFGMQYLLAGGFCLRENAHVRVDVLYTHLPPRGKAAVDVATSMFFFIFVVALLVTGWTFFLDSWSVREVSFTEWAVQYWPVKLAIPVGAALLLLQGFARLYHDVDYLVRGERLGA